MNKDIQKTLLILIAEDDEEDRQLCREALEESEVVNQVCFVENGAELLQFLRNEGKFANRVKYPRPGIILLDLNMPKMDGREALKVIKGDSDLCTIPIIVLTTSQADEDIIRSYRLGVNSFITKPLTFDSLVSVMKSLSDFWIETAVLPVPNRN